MALLYDPGTFMPESTTDFDQSSWMLTWRDGPWHLHDIELGSTVYLVRAGSTQRIVWETRVTQAFGVPYEAIGDLANEVFLRWGLVIETPQMARAGSASDGEPNRSRELIAAHSPCPSTSW